MEIASIISHNIMNTLAETEKFMHLDLFDFGKAVSINNLLGHE
jgi:hypothetical protein